MERTHCVLTKKDNEYYSLTPDTSVADRRPPSFDEKQLLRELIGSLRNERFALEVQVERLKKRNIELQRLINYQDKNCVVTCDKALDESDELKVVLEAWGDNPLGGKQLSLF